MPATLQPAGSSLVLRPPRSPWRKLPLSSPSCTRAWGLEPMLTTPVKRKFSGRASGTTLETGTATGGELNGSRRPEPMAATTRSGLGRGVSPAMAGRPAAGGCLAAGCLAGASGALVVKLVSGRRPVCGAGSSSIFCSGGWPLLFLNWSWKGRPEQPATRARGPRAKKAAKGLVGSRWANRRRNSAITLHQISKAVKVGLQLLRHDPPQDGGFHQWCQDPGQLVAHR